MRLEECPVRATLSVIGGKWKPLVACSLLDGKKRFGELRKLIPEATQKVLTQQLREMERDGIVARTVYQQVPLKVEYSLTDYGDTLRPILLGLCNWGNEHRARTSGKSQRQISGARKFANRPRTIEFAVRAPK